MVFVPAVSTFYISQKLGGTDTVLVGDVIERQFKQGNNPNLGAALSLVQPRSSAASMSRGSILTMTPYRGRII